VAAWGSAGQGAVRFQSPVAVAVDAGGSIYVADAGSDNVQKLSASGRPLATWGPRLGATLRFDRPQAIAVDRRGHVYVSDVGGGRIVELSTTGALLAVAGSSGSLPGHFRSPAGIALDGTDLYVADAGNNTVEKLVLRR
jgi:DNA-binding beta-propeller fold protein YncE